MLNRPRFLDRLSGPEWDVIVIGGGATGMGAALDAAARNYRTLLLERGDFGVATSSRSTKLIHGGVRYLAQGNIALVRESLYERGLLLRNAPALVQPLEFLVPTESMLETAYYATGLKAYDALAGSQRIRWSQALSKQAALARVSTLRPERIAGGVSYMDAQFDDARLILAAASKCAELGGTLLNRMAVTRLLKQDGRVRGVVAADQETGCEYELPARVVINATGIFTDSIRHLDEPAAAPMLQLSQGAHIVLDRSFLPGETAVIVPRTEDGRVLFLIPWQGSTLVGTTDIPVPLPTQEPRVLGEEVEYLLEYVGRYLNRQPHRQDIRSCFAGLRPLVREEGERSTAKLSRDHVISISAGGLVSIAGGKWTTFRKMGADVVRIAAKQARLESRPPATAKLPLAPRASFAALFNPRTAPPELSDELVRYFVHEEMARSLDDVLSRRTRWLLVDARRAVQESQTVARQLAAELDRDADWVQAELARFRDLAAGYLPGGLADSRT